MNFTKFCGLTLLALFGAGRVFACSCSSPRSIDATFSQSEKVVLAQLVSSEQHQVPVSQDPHALTEDAVFRVVEVFKGKLTAGDLLHVQSLLGPYGPCGISVKNSPVWLDKLKDSKPTPVALTSGKWIIFSDKEDGPVELSMCGGSVPMEASAGAGVLKWLRRRANHEPIVRK